MRSAILPLALVSMLLAAGFAPACGTPTDEDEAAVGESTGEDAYTTEGTCDGLPRLKSLKTPPGVCVGLVSQGLTFPRGIVELPSGDFVMADMGGWTVDRGAVWLLRSLGGSGGVPRTFSKTRIAKLIDKPSGVAVGPDGLPYIGTPNGVIRFDPYEATVDPVPRTGPFRTTGDYKQPRFKLVIKDVPSDGSHPLKKIVFDAKKPWTVYVNVGSKTDVCGTGTPKRYPMPCPEAEGNDARGTIRAYDLDNPDHIATNFTVVARGLRNSMALAVHPTSGALIQGENSRDAIEKADASFANTEADFPHEELNVIVPGGHYGWPYCYDNNAANPEYRGKVDCAGYQAPALLLPGHASPLGMTYYNGPLLPQAYRGQLIVGYHGYRDNGHRLVMVPVDANGIPGGGEPLDIIRGWDESPGREPLGAPVDVLAAKDGSIYITEDKNGDVLRLSFNAAEGDGLPLRALPIVRPGADPAVAARCRDLANRHDLYSEVQKLVVDNNCVNCHGVGPGYPGNLRLDKCDAVGNAKRLLEKRTGGRPALVEPNNPQSELVLRVKGEGYPPMPAGGIDPEAFAALEDWIKAGAPKP